MYTPLFIHSHYSVKEGLNNPKEIVATAKKAGMTAIAQTDINNLSGCIEFYKFAKQDKIKPIIGCLLTLDEGTVLLLAKNKLGYKELLLITSSINNGKSNFTLNDLSKYDCSNIIGIVGHEGSILYNTLSYKFQIKEAWQDLSNIVLTQLKELFKNNLYIELQFSEYDSFSSIIKEKLTDIATKYQIELVATPRVYYLDQNEKDLHQILVSEKEKKPLAALNQINTDVYKFFDGYRFYLPSYQEIIQEHMYEHHHSDTYFTIELDPVWDKALKNTNKIADEIEDYELANMPTLPKFKCPNKQTTKNHFRDLCEQGWNRKIKPVCISQEITTTYKERLENEFKVFEDAKLFDYFLIIKDILDYARSKDYLVGVGRGSSSGCLISYLLGITQIDPIRYNLLFERFYNAGREKSLPDIDCDFESRSREDIINYITKKYGKVNVGQISTYGTLMGRAALKAVFRAYNDMSFSEQNEITKVIPDKAKISDELQAMKDPSVIKWTLINKRKYLENWCVLNDDKLEGPLAEKFRKAIQLEGVYVNKSKHAAGVVIGPTVLDTLVPMIFDDKSKKQIIGCEMNELEYIGLCKMDILGLSVLDKIKDINKD